MHWSFKAVARLFMPLDFCKHIIMSFKTAFTEQSFTEEHPVTHIDEHRLEITAISQNTLNPLPPHGLVWVSSLLHITHCPLTPIYLTTRSVSPVLLSHCPWNNRSHPTPCGRQSSISQRIINPCWGSWWWLTWWQWEAALSCRPKGFLVVSTSLRENSCWWVD